MTHTNKSPFCLNQLEGYRITIGNEISKPYKSAVSQPKLVIKIHIHLGKMYNNLYEERRKANILLFSNSIVVPGF